MKIKKVEPKKININDLKPRRRRVGTNARNVDHTCPNCKSILITSTDGSFQCSGNKLKVWESDFQKYILMNEHDRLNYLGNFADQDRFLELFNKWNYVDDNGLRINFECGYNNKLYNTNSDFNVKIPDPLFLNRIEKSLGRPLTDEELMGDKPLYVKDGTYFATKVEGGIKVDIPYVNFPSDF